MSRDFEVLIFDWDGTLFDSIGWIVHCLQRAAVDCGLPMPPEAAARSVIGLGLHEAMAALYPGKPFEKALRLAEHYRHHYEARPVTPEGLFAGVPELLDTLRERGYRLAVATGKARRGLDRALAATGLADRFHATRCADETASKPHPEMLFQLMAELSVVPERTLMIGDAVHDLDMARNAGVAAVGVGCGANELERLAALNPWACLPTTPDLLNLLN